MMAEYVRQIPESIARHSEADTQPCKKHMTKTKLIKRSLLVALICMALPMFVHSASAALTVSTAAQYGSLNEFSDSNPNPTPFTPTWTLPGNNLIAGMSPSYEWGTYNADNTNCDLISLTSVTSDAGLAVGSVGANNPQGPDNIGNSTVSSNYLTFGNGYPAIDYGDQLVYTLPASTYGYNLTNITVYGGWQDGGRCSQDYTVLYSTVANPDSFIMLTNVNYHPSPPNGNACSSQVILSDSAGGVIASNVAAVEFDFSCPGSENGWVGYGAIFAQGSAASSLNLPAVSITTSNEQSTNLYPTVLPNTNNDLILGLIPSNPGGDNADGNLGGVSVLTDGLLATNIVQGGPTTWEVQCASLGASACSSLIYTLPTNVNGYNITNIAVYDTWQDEGRDGQYYTVSYATVSDPTAYIPIATVYFNPAGNLTPSANQVVINALNGGPLGTGVGTVKFDFGAPPSAGSFNNGWSGYDQIVVQGVGTPNPPPPPSPILSQDILPTYAETVVGDQVVFTADFTNAPPANLQWLYISNYVSGGNTFFVTNPISGATSPTLTLNNVQTNNSGYYELEAVNATNGAAAPAYSSQAQLVVGNTPAPVNGIIVDYAGQSGWGSASAIGVGTNFTPTFTINTNNDFILGSQDTFVSGPVPGAPGTANSAGDFSAGGAGNLNLDPAILSDGTFGYMSHWPGVGTSPTEVGCGVGGPGEYVIYALTNYANPNSPYGFEVTNITVFGGWGDSGRNEQKYQVLYSTIAAPTNFNNLITVDYNPNDPNNGQSGTRTTLIPVNGVLAQNVAAIEINWSLQGGPPKNDWEGYSEIVVSGTNATGLPPVLTQDITPLAAEDVVGSSLTLTATFSGATSYQWLENGTNIPGATSSTLTINHLQSSNTATNGGYVLKASNAEGSSVTRGCTVIVDPTPIAINNVIESWAYQVDDAATWGPTWATNDLSSSLIFGQNLPADTYDPIGDFNDPDSDLISFGLAGGLPVLTDGNYGMIVPEGPHPAFATGGPQSVGEGSGASAYSTNSGEYVVYTLGTNPNGYNVTNIQIAGGWNDNGRDSQYYTVSYSTVANPTLFVPLVIASNNIPDNTNSINYQLDAGMMIRGTFTPASGVLASNVYAIYVDFTSPGGDPNGYSGYNEISVFGSPSAVNTSPIAVTGSNENTASPTWTPETPDLILGQLPSSMGTGSFAGGFNNEAVTEGLPALTDGTLGPFEESDTNFATCGGAYGAGSSVTYSSANGWNLTNIVVYSGWGDYNRGGQFYNISYATLSAPTTFVPLTSVSYNPLFNPPANYDVFNTLVTLEEPSGAQANRVAISPANGAATLATNVYAVKFDFTPQTDNLDNGYSGYSEIILQGAVLGAPTAGKFTTSVLSGGNLILTGTSSAANAGRAYNLLSSTNLLTPLADWTIVGTGDISGTGSFSNSIPVNPSQPATFFLLKTY